jgi:shikimate dehydrogenase
MNILNSGKELKLFGVVGSPIAHSKSPDIFNSLFEKRSLSYRYLRLAVTDSKRVLSLCEELSIKGLNITAPYKESIYSNEIVCDPVSKELEAVNSLVSCEGSYYGYNSDIDGVYLSLKRYQLSSKKILVVGSGGAAKAAIYALRDFDLTVINRTNSKAKKISKKFNIRFSPFSHIEHEINSSDVVVSTLPDPSLVLSPNWFEGEKIFFDANYKSEFKVGRQTKYLNGKDWLINQAIPSVKRFCNIDTDYNEIDKLLQKVKKKRNITLIGFMGCGKTTYSRHIAKKIGYNWIDLDQEIERENGESISEIFKTKGEGRFREIESEILRRYIKLERCIISCGGGIIESQKNRCILKSSFNVWIYNSFDTCYQRIKCSSRPLVGKNLKEIYRRRFSLYAEVTDLLFDPPASIAEGVEYLFKEIEISGVL